MYVYRSRQVPCRFRCFLQLHGAPKARPLPEDPCDSITSKEHNTSNQNLTLVVFGHVHSFSHKGEQASSLRRSWARVATLQIGWLPQQYLMFSFARKGTPGEIRPRMHTMYPFTILGGVLNTCLVKVCPTPPLAKASRTYRNCATTIAGITIFRKPNPSTALQSFFWMLCFERDQVVVFCGCSVDVKISTQTSQLKHPRAVVLRAQVDVSQTCWPGEAEAGRAGVTL